VNSNISIVLVGTQTPGNIGTTARAMKNFGFSKLLLIDPPELDRNGEAYGFAGQARVDILPNRQIVSFNHIVENYHTIAFTAVTNQSGAEHVRFPFINSKDLLDEISKSSNPVALVFGRESTGLTNKELEKLDRICSIPASSLYPTLNLGQAVTIVLYELSSLTLTQTQHPDQSEDMAQSEELEDFFAHFSSLLSALSYPVHKHKKTMLLIRRIFGRANPTSRELTTLRGVFRRAIRRSNNNFSKFNPLRIVITHLRSFINFFFKN
jgi:tRNA (cytidine32/uridine32-2'-O)-methyltransferase